MSKKTNTNVVAKNIFVTISDGINCLIDTACDKPVFDDNTRTISNRHNSVTEGRRCYRREKKEQALDNMRAANHRSNEVKTALAVGLVPVAIGAGVSAVKFTGSLIRDGIASIQDAVADAKKAKEREYQITEKVFELGYKGREAHKIINEIIEGKIDLKDVPQKQQQATQGK